jgi:hypothetical protein
MVNLITAQAMSVDELTVEITKIHTTITLLQENIKRSDFYCEYKELRLNHGFYGNGYLRLLQPRRWKRAEEEYRNECALYEMKLAEANRPIEVLAAQLDSLYKMLNARILENART